MGEALELIGARAQTNALEERDRIPLGCGIADGERLHRCSRADRRGLRAAEAS